MLISIVEWANKVGLHPARARKKASSGMLQTAVKIGRDWLVDSEEPNVDHRFKDNKKEER